MSSTLTRYSLPVSFTPQLTICLVDEARQPSRSASLSWSTVLPVVLALLALLLVLVQHAQIQDLHAHFLGPQLSQGAFGEHPAASSRTITGGAGQPTINASNGGHSETSVSVLDKTRMSLALPEDFYDLLAKLSAKAAIDTVGRWLASVMGFLRRLMHYPLQLDD